MSVIEIISKFYPLVFTILQLMILIVIKMNDLKHIAKVVDEINKKIMEHESRISKIEGKLNGKSN